MPKDREQPLEITVREDPVSDTWIFTLHSHEIELERAHGFVKIDGQVYEADAVKGLEEVEDLHGEPLEIIGRLIHRHEEDQHPPGTPPPETEPRTTQPKKAGRQARPRRASPVRKRAAKPRPQEPARKTPAPSNAPPAASTQKLVYATKDAAKYVGLSPKTLERLRTKGGGPRFHKLGRRVVYREEDLEQWLQERARRSTSDPGNA